MGERAREKTPKNEKFPEKTQVELPRGGCIGRRGSQRLAFDPHADGELAQGFAFDLPDPLAGQA